MRRFIRHPSDIPMEVQLENESPSESTRLSDVSVGGLCFIFPRPQPIGAHLLIRIGLVRPPFEAKVRVVWCRPADDRYDVGVQLMSEDDAFRARMVQQACHIEQYKRRALALEGRRLSGEEAALEWINKYAESFPSLDGRH